MPTMTESTGNPQLMYGVLSVLIEIKHYFRSVPLLPYVRTIDNNCRSIYLRRINVKMGRCLVRSCAIYLPKPC